MFTCFCDLRSSVLNDSVNAGIVNETLASGMRFTRTGLVRWAKLQKFKVLYYTDKLRASTPTSQLHPRYANDSQAESIIRWTSTPVWNNGPGSPGLPDAVFIFGSIVNGKTTITEIANIATGQGYSAVYYRNSTADYVLASSILRSSNGSFVVDEHIEDTDWLEPLRTNGRWRGDSSYTVQTVARAQGRRYYLSARCHTKNAKIGPDSASEQLIEWTGMSGPLPAQQ
jgi:hypothetical protein